MSTLSKNPFTTSIPDSPHTLSRHSAFGFDWSFDIRNSSFAPRPLLAIVTLVVSVLAPTLIASTIPDRAGKLVYPRLAYESPAPEKFRVQLTAGPIAYVAADRELPLVNIVVYAHTGAYVEPPGKEGLAALTGYLLARGGIKTKTA